MSSLPPEVGWYLAPQVSGPFDNLRSICILCKPRFGAGYEVEHRRIRVGLRQTGIAVPAAHPGYGVRAVRIERHVRAVLFQEGKSVDYGEKLAYVVRRLVERPHAEYLLARRCPHAPVLHTAGVAAARRVHSYARHNGTPRVGILRIGRGVRTPPDGFPIIHRMGGAGLILCRIALVLCAVKAQNLSLALLPRCKNPRLTAAPYHIVLVLRHKTGVLPNQFFLNM